MKDYEELSDEKLAEVLRLKDAFCCPENRIFAIAEALARLLKNRK